MKARLSSTIWLLTAWTGAALLGVLGLAYNAGKNSGGQSLLNLASLPSAAGTAVFGALALALLAVLSLIVVLNTRVLKPAGELAQFSERLAAGDARARAEIKGQDEFAFIADNCNRSAAKVAHAMSTQ